jgi:hypothetical protein
MKVIDMCFFRVSVFSIIVAMGAVKASAAILPADSQGNWAAGVTVGVPGGITQYTVGRTNIIDVTKAPYNADNTGATDAGISIQAAINAAPQNSVIYLPPGIYRFDGGPVVDPWHGRANLTIRGAGTNTIIKTYGNAVAFNISSSAGHDYQPSGIIAGLNKGSTSITVSNTPWYPPWGLVHLSIPDSTNVFSVYGFPKNRHQKAIITGISGNRLTISPPLLDDYPAGTAIEFSQFQVNNVGLENFVIDASNSSQVFAVQFGQTYGCWMSGVQVKYAANYCVYVYDSLFFEMRGCTIGPVPTGGSNHSGLLHNTCSGSLIEDNVFTEAGPLVEINFGSSGNVFAYNLFDKGVININHGPHNFLNLFEGNVGVNFQSDGYFGGSSQDTLFRNWFNGNYGGSQQYVGSLNRFVRRYNFIGNIFGCADFPWSGDGISTGNPNIGNSSFLGSQSGNNWADWDKANNYVKTWHGVVSQRISDSAGVLTLDTKGVVTSLTNIMVLSHANGIFGASFANFVTVGAVNGSTIAISQASTPLPPVGASVTLTPSPSGFQEKDLDVAGTLFRKGNYNYFDKAIPAAEALGTDTLPNSLFRTSKPAFFATLPWPPFDPANPNPARTAIPAGYRFINGTNPPAGKILSPPSGLKILQ